MNYLGYFRLKKEPFSNAPIQEFFYSSKSHSDAILRLKYAVSSMKGLAVLTGEIGAGKTTLAKRLLGSLNSSKYLAGMMIMVHSRITPIWFLKRVLALLGVEDESTEKLRLLTLLHKRLIDLNDKNIKPIILIDEAQMLQSREIMEEIRGILNMELPHKKLITFILFGLKELEENIHLDEPLAQRVALNFRLSSLTLIATENYIKHRLRLSGAKRMFFSKEAVEKIYYYSRGIPRLINTICDNAMFETFIQKKTVIDEILIKDVSLSLGLNYYLTNNQQVTNKPINKRTNVLNYKAIDDILSDFNNKKEQ